MAERDVKLLAQLMAIEHMLTQHIAIRYASKGYTLDLVKTMHKLQVEQAKQESFPTPNAALSDHVAAEYEVELERLLHAVEEHLAAALAK